MRLRQAITAALLAFVAVSAAYVAVREIRAGGRADARGGAASAPAESEPGAGVLVYYFHSSQRCAVCNTVEALTARTLRERFAAELNSGKLAWRTVDYDRPGGKRYIKEFELAGNAVIVLDRRAGRRTPRELGDVWRLTGDPVAFSEYVGREVSAVLAGG